MVGINEPGWMQAKLSEEFTRQGLRIADELRRAADRIESEAKDVHADRTTGLPDHNIAATGVLTAIDTFHGNLATSSLLTAAADADRHARSPEGNS